METPNNILDIRNLSVGFRSGSEMSLAVSEISFSLGRGESIGIVGESGSGKSVTSLSVMRLIADPPGRITSGEIFYYRRKNTLDDTEKLELSGLSEKKMQGIRGKEIAMIFQEPMTSLNPVLTCGEQVMEAIRLHEPGFSKLQVREKTLELFKQVLLPRPEAILDAYPHQLSGGQKQRVMIAMAISCNPAILIADEPTTALDVTVQAAILELLKKLQADRQMSMIFISHDLGVIAEIADRVLVMYKGRFVEQGPVKEVFSNPVHPYTKGLLACRPSLNTRLSKLPVISDFMVRGQDGEMMETGSNIAEIQAKYTVTREKKEEQRAGIYRQKPVLRVTSLKTWFPLKRGFLNKDRNFIKAVDDISFEVYPGETLGLVGESGCGKTTLGRSILRLIEPTGGEVIFKDQNLRALESKEMRKVRKQLQIIFQDPYSSLNPRMTIGEAIIEPMMVHRLYENDVQRKKKVMELLERVNLNPVFYNRYPHEFSGGQRQRVVIARALAVQPEFIICDESVSALDVSVQAQVLNLLNELKSEFGLSYIFISHDLGVVKFMSDRMIVMNKGKMEEIGDPDQIYQNPASGYTKKLIDAIPKKFVTV